MEENCKPTQNNRAHYDVRSACPECVASLHECLSADEQPSPCPARSLHVNAGYEYERVFLIAEGHTVYEHERLSSAE